MPYADPEKKREAKRRYRERNKTKITEHHRAWAAANPEKVKAANDRYRATHSEKVKERTKASTSWKATTGAPMAS